MKKETLKKNQLKDLKRWRHQFEVSVLAVFLTHIIIYMHVALAYTVQRQQQTVSDAQTEAREAQTEAREAQTEAREARERFEEFQGNYFSIHYACTC